MDARRRVLLVDDHPVVLRGLRALLAGADWVEDVHEADTGAGALAEALLHDVQVVAMDIQLPDRNGIDVTQELCMRLPGVAVMMLTMSENPDHVARALRVGARGFLLKRSDPDVIMEALRVIAHGGIVLGPQVGALIVDALTSGPTSFPPPLDKLAPRQLQILAQLAAGDTAAHIARGLGVKEKTVRNQLSAIYTMIGASDRLQAARMAEKAGLTPERL